MSLLETCPNDWESPFDLSLPEDALFAQMWDECEYYVYDSAYTGRHHEGVGYTSRDIDWTVERMENDAVGRWAHYAATCKDEYDAFAERLQQ
jgi:hypothetical protein